MFFLCPIVAWACSNTLRLFQCRSPDSCIAHTHQNHKIFVCPIFSSLHKYIRIAGRWFAQFMFKLAYTHQNLMRNAVTAVLGCAAYRWLFLAATCSCVGSCTSWSHGCVMPPSFSATFCGQIYYIHPCALHKSNVTRIPFDLIALLCRGLFLWLLLLLLL